MRVLVLSHLYPRSSAPWSGIFVAEQVAALRREGIDARVLWGHGVGMPLTAPPVPGAWVGGGVPEASFAYRVPHRLWRFLAGQAYAAAALRACRSLAASFPFDLVHAHTSWLDGHAAAVIRRSFHVPMVLTEHSGPFSTQVDNLLKRRATRQALTEADRVMAVSGFLRRQMSDAFPDLASRPIAIIGNGIAGDDFPMAGPRDPSLPPSAVWVGGFLPIKQPLMMLRAFAAAKMRSPGLTLHLVGEGPLEPAMRAEAAALDVTDALTWHGSLPRPEVARRLAACDFMIVSSAAETFSVATLEALAVGRPVVSTRCGGPEEILDRPALGSLVDNDEAALAQGIVEMALACRSHDPATLRRAALERFGHPVIAARLVATYNSLLAREAA
jgi:glycosyltransferase involved in cell wall biosynthesis